SSGLRRFLPLCHVHLFTLSMLFHLSLYPFTERYAQPYFFSCLIRQRGITSTISLPNKHPCLSFHVTFAMSTQKDIYAAGSESRPPMLNKENYVPWSSRLLRYAKSDVERDVNVNETFHEQTDDELSERELKQIETDDQAIETILLGLPEDIYAAVDSCETA
nr:hypothetical protein [Tanacetum cinerariifolium]